jgi:hypothetical protein
MTPLDHPLHHVSFASTHGKEPFTAAEVPKLNSSETITQMLWPDHCVQGEGMSDQPPPTT